MPDHMFSTAKRRETADWKHLGAFGRTYIEKASFNEVLVKCPLSICLSLCFSCISFKDWKHLVGLKKKMGKC